MSEQLVKFARALRAEGLAVGTGSVADFVRAVELVEDLYWAGRATLVSAQGEIAVYDRVFAEFFGGVRRRPEHPRRPSEVAASIRPQLAGGGMEQGGRGIVAASSVEVLRRKRLGALTEEELGRLDLLATGARRATPTRRSRRRRGAARAGEPDLRRTLRLSVRTGGEPLRLAWRTRVRRRRRVVMLLDVSGSMTEHVRPLVVLGRALLQADRCWEVFCFATRLTRVTRALGEGDPDGALRRAAAEVVDWDGGTRIGESLKTFIDVYGHGGMARGAVVVVCSDGLDVGRPELLAEQMGRLARLAHRIVWLNPLAQSPAYEPLAAGMAAALPHVDVLTSSAADALTAAVAPVRSRWAG